MARIASGSPPSTTSCSPRFTNGSCLPLDQRLEAQQPLLARDVAPLDDLLDERLGLQRRRLEDPGTRRIACLNTGSGVWMKMEAMVPTTTIMNAADDSSA